MKKNILIAFLLYNFGMYAQPSVDRQISKHDKSSSESVFSQLPEFKDNIGDLTIKLDDNNSKLIKFGLNSQIWFRSIENNPGTLVNELPQENTFDVGLRRMRLTMQAQLSPWYKIFFHVGINNQSFITGGGSGTGAVGAGKKPQIFFMDAYNELTIVPEVNLNTLERNNFNMHLGAGLHAVNGISRLSNISTSKILMGDLPIFNYPNIEMSDQFARQLGVFTRGQFHDFDYRFAVNKPFATSLKPEIGQIVENNQLGKLSYNGYVMYQFLDKESTSSPYFSGFYLGTKKVFNIGAGFYSTKEASLEQSAEGIFKRYNHQVLSADVFLDTPIGQREKGMSLNMYSVVYKYNYGKNFVRNIGIMNPGTIDANFTGSTALEGAGNARNMFGTGNVWFTQAAVVLPKQISKSLKIQPFVGFTYKKLDALNEVGYYYDFGLNFFIFSQNARLTYNFASRPIYDKNNKTVFDRKGEHIIMLQVNF